MGVRVAAGVAVCVAAGVLVVTGLNQPTVASRSRSISSRSVLVLCEWCVLWRQRNLGLKVLVGGVLLVVVVGVAVGVVVCVAVSVVVDDVIGDSVGDVIRSVVDEDMVVAASVVEANSISFSTGKLGGVVGAGPGVSGGGVGRSGIGRIFFSFSR